MYARGLSMRDIEAAFTDERGRSVLTRSSASRVAERLWDDYQAFATRSLQDVSIVYLFVDGVAERLHLCQPREAVLAGWGTDSNGAKHLLGLLPATKEHTACWRDFLRDLKASGAHRSAGHHRWCAGTDPRRARSDAARAALALPGAQDKMRNLQSKVPEERWREVGPAAHAVYQAPSQALARLAADVFRQTWSRELPVAVDDDFDACIAHLQLPIAHQRITRTTNLLERLFGEERRRTEVIPHAFVNARDETDVRLINPRQPNLARCDHQRVRRQATADAARGTECSI